MLGVTGPISGAEFVQEAFHSTAAEDSRIATWNKQIKNNVHGNIYVNYIKEWKLFPKPLVCPCSGKSLVLLREPGMYMFK